MEPKRRKAYVNLISLTIFVVLSSQGDECLDCINSRRANKMNRKREKKYIQSDQPASKPRRSFSYTIITKNSLFLTVLLLFAQFNMRYWLLVTWLDWLACRLCASLSPFTQFSKLFHLLATTSASILSLFDTYYSHRCLRWQGTAARIKSTPSPKEALGFLGQQSSTDNIDAHKWSGVANSRRNYWVMTFQVSSSNWARLRLIWCAVSGVIFVVLKSRAR
jgi:hypothetical protein